LTNGGAILGGSGGKTGGAGGSGVVNAGTIGTLANSGKIAGAQQTPAPQSVSDR
jgi:hypothetical protein